MPTSRRLVQFSNGKNAPEGARIVYIDGAFDCFHPGHVKILRVRRGVGQSTLGSKRFDFLKVSRNMLAFGSQQYPGRDVCCCS